MKSNEITKQAHKTLLESKLDASWERYFAGWVDVVDRYNVTSVLVQGQKVLDIGCGEGLLGFLLKGKYVIGIDACESIIVLGKSRPAHIADLRVMDAENLTFENGEFDTVVLGQVLEHVVDVDKTIQEALRVLKPGGRLIVNVPCDDAEPRGNHLHVFESLQELLELFPVKWEGKGILHRFYFAWGIK